MIAVTFDQIKVAYAQATVFADLTWDAHDDRVDYTKTLDRPTT